MPRGIFKPIGAILFTKIATYFQKNQKNAEFDLGLGSREEPDATP